MSHDVSINVHLGPGYAVLAALNALLQSGWSYDDHGSISFLPLGSGDSFDWQRKQLSQWNEVELELQQKEQRAELVGVVLVWPELLRGGPVLFFEDKICLSANVNRVRLAHSSFTDFSWYLERLIPAFGSGAFEIRQISCSDFW